MGKNRHKSRLIKLAAASLASLTLLGMGTGIHAASVNKAAVSHPNIVATQPKASRHTAVRASKTSQKALQASGQQKAKAYPTASQDNTGNAANGKANNAGQNQTANQKQNGQNQQGQKQNSQSKPAQAALTAQNNANAQPADGQPTVIQVNHNNGNQANGNQNKGNTNKQTAPAKVQPAKPVNYTYYRKLNKTGRSLAKKAKLNVKTLTAHQVSALNKVRLNDKRPAGTRLTYRQMQDITNTLVKQDRRYAIPFFKASKIGNLPAATAKNAITGKVEKMDIWDSWPVINAKTGNVYNWHGYQLVIGMAGQPKVSDNHLYLLYSKYNNHSLKGWKNAGSIFGYHETEARQEWSGSATVNKDGSLQLYYARVHAAIPWDPKVSNHQMLATATIKLKRHKNRTLSIGKVYNDRVIFQGDGKYYQSYKEWQKHYQNDNFCLRDAHVYETKKGNRYLFFESATGSLNPASTNQVYNWKNYGGSTKYRVATLLDSIDNPYRMDRISVANAALGVLRLTRNQKRPKVAKLYKPVITANMVSDELERPVVFRMNKRYYLFTAARITRGVDERMWAQANNTVGDNVIMLGWSSKYLTHGYKPLNKSSVVLTASVPANWRTETYSYLAVPVKHSKNKMLITAYMSDRSFKAGVGHYTTFAPAFVVQLNKKTNTTSIVRLAAPQGTWHWSKKFKNNSYLGHLKDAYLPNEAASLKNYKLKDHYPMTVKQLNALLKKEAKKRAVAKKAAKKRAAKKRAAARKAKKAVKKTAKKASKKNLKKAVRKHAKKNVAKKNVKKSVRKHSRKAGKKVLHVKKNRQLKA